jgi:hypothetical protein
LRSAIEATLLPIKKDPNCEIHYQEISPVKPYPYPWKYTEFFDVFPETVNGVPCEIQATTFDATINYDLIIIGYQPWFLSVCVPVNSFLQSDVAKKVLNGKNVVTIIACRNMWLSAQEKMKVQLQKLNANLVGNITFVDKSANLISLVTVLAFVLKGVKEKFLGIFPKYGVTEKDLSIAPTFGKIVLKHLNENNYTLLQSELNETGATTVKGNLLIMEGRGRALFPIYAKFITAKGPQGSKERRFRVKTFGIVLPTLILLLSPIITILSRLAPLLLAKKFAKEIAYYAQNKLRS